jgi:hypothetical protein
VAKKRWGNLSKARQVKRLGRRLDVTFTFRVAVGMTDDTGGMVEVGRDAWVALEIERKRGHPVENVLKYWPWLDRSSRRLVLVHAITPNARRRVGSRAELTKWLGALMERVLPGRFTYCWLELGSESEDIQLEAVIDAITELRQPRAARSPAAGLLPPGRPRGAGRSAATPLT